jgi:hypothetical protein
MRLALAGSRETGNTSHRKLIFTCEGFHRGSDSGDPIGDIGLTGFDGIT